MNLSIKSPLSYNMAVKIGEIAMSDNEGLLENKNSYISLMLCKQKKMSIIIDDAGLDDVPLERNAER